MQEQSTQSLDSGLMTHKIDHALFLKIALDHPAEKVWPYVLHWDLWVNDTEFREYRVAGALDTEGEIKKVIHFDTTGRLDLEFYAEVVKIIPCKRLVYKILSALYVYDAATGARSELPFTGYEIYELREEKGKTVLTFDFYAEETRAAAISKEEARRVANEFVAAKEADWYGRYFPRLVTLLAKGHV
jgi:hypothetical protein